MFKHIASGSFFQYGTGNYNARHAGFYHRHNSSWTAGLREVHLAANNLPADTLLFWLRRSGTYSSLVPAADLVCASASWAFVERIFTVCGILCFGRRWRSTAVWNLTRKFSVTFFFLGGVTLLQCLCDRTCDCDS